MGKIYFPPGNEDEGDVKPVTELMPWGIDSYFLNLWVLSGKVPEGQDRVIEKEEKKGWELGDC